MEDPLGRAVPANVQADLAVFAPEQRPRNGPHAPRRPAQPHQSPTGPGRTAPVAPPGLGPDRNHTRPPRRPARPVREPTPA